MQSNFVKMLNNPLGASAPFGANMCHADLGMVAGMGFGMLGSAIDAMSQEDTNYTNRAIAEETNESNQEINRQQLAWAREQYELEKAENRFLVDQAWNREVENRDYMNKYNSPQEMIKRLKAAHLNPTLAMYGSGGSGGSSSMSAAASTGSNPHANQPSMIPMQTGAPMQAFHGFGVAAQNAANYYLAAQRNIADIAAMRAHTDNETMETISKVLLNDAHNGKLRAEMGKILDDIRWNRENWDERSRQLKVANDKIFADQQYQEAMTAYQKIVNQYAPKMQEKLMAQYDANYDALMAAANEHNENALLAAANKALVGVEKDTKEGMKAFIIDKAKSDADAAYWHSEREGRSYLLGNKLGDTTPAMDPNGKSYTSPNKMYRGYIPWNNRGPYHHRRDLDHVGQ